MDQLAYLSAAADYLSSSLPSSSQRPLFSDFTRPPYVDFTPQAPQGDPHTVGAQLVSILGAYGPLIQTPLAERLINAHNKGDLDILSRLLHTLAAEKKAALSKIVAMLARVGEESSKSGMSHSSLATVFAPLLVMHPDKASSVKLLLYLIASHRSLFVERGFTPDAAKSDDEVRKLKQKLEKERAAHELTRRQLEDHWRAQELGTAPKGVHPYIDLAEKHRLELELQEAKAGLQDLVDELLSTEDELASKKVLVSQLQGHISQMGHPTSLGDTDIVSRMDRILGREHLEVENMRMTSELQKKEEQLHTAQTELVKAQARAAQCEDEAKAHQDVIKGLQGMLDESYRLLSVLQHDQSVAASRTAELQDYAMGIKDTKAEMEQAFTVANSERARLAKENENLGELYKIASDSLREVNDRMEKTLAANASKIAQLENDLVAAQAENSKLKIDVAKLTSDMEHKASQMTQQAEKLKTANKKLQSELDALNAENTKKKNEELEARVSHLNQLCAELQDTATQQTAKVRELEPMRDRAEALAKHLAQLEELAEDRLAQLTTAQRKEKEVEDVLGEKESELNTIKRKLAAAEAKIKDLETFAENRFGEFKITLADLDVLRPKLEECQAENKSLLAKLDALTLENAELDSLRQRFENAQCSIAELAEENGVLNSQLEDVTLQLNEVEHQLVQMEHLEGTLRDTRHALEECQLQLRETIILCDNNTRDRDNLAVKVELQTARCEGYERAHNALSSQVDDLQSQVEQFQRDRDEHLSMIGDQKTQLYETRSERDLLRNKLSELETLVANQKAEIEETLVKGKFASDKITSLEKVVDDWQIRQNELNQDLIAKSAEIEDLTQKKKEMEEKEKKWVKKERDFLRNAEEAQIRMEAFEDSHTSIDARLKEREALLEDLRERERMITKSNRDLERTLEETARKCGDLEILLEEKTRIIDEFERQDAEARKKERESLKKRRENDDDWKRKLRETESELDAWTARAHESAALAEERAKKLKDLEARWEEKEKLLKGQIADSSIKILDLEKSILRLQDFEKMAKHELEEKAKDVKMAQEMLATQKEKEAEIARELQQNLKRLEKSKLELAEKNERVATLENKIDVELANVTSAHLQELEAAKSKITDLESQLQKLQAQIGDLQEIKQKLEDERERDGERQKQNEKDRPEHTQNKPANGREDAEDTRARREKWKGKKRALQAQVREAAQQCGELVTQQRNLEADLRKKGMEWEKLRQDLETEWKEKEVILQEEIAGVLKACEDTMRVREDALRREHVDALQRADAEVRTQLESRISTLETQVLHNAALRAQAQKRVEALESESKLREEEMRFLELETRNAMQQRETEWNSRTLEREAAHTEDLRKQQQDALTAALAREDEWKKREEGEWKEEEYSLREKLHNLGEELKKREQELKESEREFHKILAERELEWRSREDALRTELESAVRAHAEELAVREAQLRKEFEQAVRAHEAQWKTRESELADKLHSSSTQLEDARTHHTESMRARERELEATLREKYSTDMRAKEDAWLNDTAAQLDDAHAQHAESRRTRERELELALREKYAAELRAKEDAWRTREEEIRKQMEMLLEKCQEDIQVQEEERRGRERDLEERVIIAEGKFKKRLKAEGETWKAREAELLERVGEIEQKYRRKMKEKEEGWKEREAQLTARMKVLDEEFEEKQRELEEEWKKRENELKDRYGKTVESLYEEAKHREKDWRNRENGWKDNSAKIVEDLQLFKRHAQ